MVGPAFHTPIVVSGSSPLVIHAPIVVSGSSPAVIRRRSS
jgi:hypothetical protein